MSCFDFAALNLNLKLKIYMLVAILEVLIFGFNIGHDPINWNNSFERHLDSDICIYSTLINFE